MLKKYLFLSVFLLVSCAHQPARISQTTWPQAVINKPQEYLHDKTIEVFSSKGFSLDSESNSLIQFRLVDKHSEMAKAFFGCGGCGDPYIKVNVVLSPVSEGTLMVVQYWRIVPKFNGSESRMDMTSNVDFNEWQNFLWQVRDKFGPAKAESMQYVQ